MNSTKNIKPDKLIDSFTNTNNSNNTNPKPSSEYANVNDNLFITDKYDVKNNSSNKKSTWHWVQVAMACTIKFILTIIAGYLSWQCSESSHLIIRILITLFSLMFSELYIIYYSIYRVYMGNKCPI